MNLKGRPIDPIKFWEGYVEFPANMPTSAWPFLPLVYCPNPSHDNTRSPAFQINVEQPTVHCFSRCGISGSYQHAVCVIHDLYDKHKVEEAKSEIERRRRVAAAFRDARRIILRAAAASGHAPNGKTKSARKRSEPAEPVVELAYSKFIPAAGTEYLTRRGISSNSMAQWELGWDDDELRVVIPAHDERGQVRFLIKRAVRPKDRPKYLYSEHAVKESLLFGAGRIDLGMVRSHGIVVVEGSIDTISNHQDGLRTTVGTLGTGISIHQARILDALRPPLVFLMFDRDVAGVHGIEMAREYLPKSRLLVCRYPKDKFDPAEMTKAEKHRSLAKAISVAEFLRAVKRGGQ